MNLYFMRHAKAEDHAQSDSERKLTVEGQLDVDYVAMAFLRREWELPKKLITSPYKRAVETANIMAEKLGIKDIKVVSYEEAVMWSKMKTYINGEAMLFVGHQPFIGEIIEELTGKSLSIKKASIHKMDYDFIMDKGDYLDKIESR